ncbi:MAG: hypothetical protein HY791_34785 [Deltaproteobacteria bacterium]|nr:hypothetical protein [Deltaproteobacteria bacterium]
MLKFVCIPALLSLASCTVVTESDPIAPPATGFLTAVWSIAGAQDARACARWDVAEVSMAVFDLEGFLVSRRSSPCEVFELSAELDTGPYGTRFYDAEVLLLGTRGEPASDLVELFDLQVQTDRDLTVYVDFPPGSIL